MLPPAADICVTPRAEPWPPGLDGAPLLAYAGTLAAADGVDLLLAALRALRRRHRTLRLVLAGGGATAGPLEERIAAAGLNGFVRLTGLLAGRRAADVLARADIAVFPAGDRSPKTIAVTVGNNEKGKTSATVALRVPAGWIVRPASAAIVQGRRYGRHGRQSGRGTGWETSLPGSRGKALSSAAAGVCAGEACTRASVSLSTLSGWWQAAR